jgi:hypothetical protein
VAYGQPCNADGRHGLRDELAQSGNDSTGADVNVPNALSGNGEPGSPHGCVPPGPACANQGPSSPNGGSSSSARGRSYPARGACSLHSCNGQHNGPLRSCSYNSECSVGPSAGPASEQPRSDDPTAAAYCRDNPSCALNKLDTDRDVTSTPAHGVQSHNGQSIRAFGDGKATISSNHPGVPAAADHAPE